MITEVISRNQKIAGPTVIAPGPTQTPEQIQKVDPPLSSIIRTIGVFESRIGGSTFWILPGVWVESCTQGLFGDLLGDY